MRTRELRFIEEVGTSVGPIVAVFIAAALLAFILTPIVRRIVLRYRIVDRPNEAAGGVGSLSHGPG